MSGSKITGNRQVALEDLLSFTFPGQANELLDEARMHPGVPIIHRDEPYRFQAHVTYNDGTYTVETIRI